MAGAPGRMGAGRDGQHWAHGGTNSVFSDAATAKGVWQVLHPLMEPGSLVKISSLALLNSKSAILKNSVSTP